MLLTLPRELRLLIFEHLFADTQKIVIGCRSDLPWEGRPKDMHPTITAVSRQIRSEALPLYYRNRDVVLVLRYREGRAQIQHWLQFMATDVALSKCIETVWIQYFESAHRTTALQLDVKVPRLLNRRSWVHPMTVKPLRLFEDVKSILSRTQLPQSEEESGVAELLSEVVKVMTLRVLNTHLMQHESMASLRLHGYSDFQLRLEIVSLM